MKPQLGDVINRMLTEDDGKAAASSLAAYFYPGAYTGAYFEKYARRGTDRIVAEDIVAVSMLSVDIPPRVSNWILGDGSRELTDGLTRLREDLRIEDADLSKGSEVWIASTRLWIFED